MKKSYKIIITVALILLVLPSLVFSQENKETIVKASDIIKSLNKGEDVFYENAVIKGDLDLTTLKKKSKSIIWDYEYTIYLDSQICFKNCIFEGNLIAGTGYYYESDIPKDIISIVFEKNVIMMSCEIKGDTVFSHAEFNGKSHFEGLYYHKNAYFDNMTTSQSLILSGEMTMVCDGNFNLSNTKVKGDLSVWYAEFKSGVDMSYVDVLGYLSFSGSIFEGDLESIALVAHSNVSFNGSVFKSNIRMEFCLFAGSCDFSYCEFNRLASFYYSQFTGTLELTKAEFKNETNFSDCTFLSNMNLNETTFILGNPFVN